MENLRAESGLAFCMNDESRVDSTRRKIARVPLSDYVLDSESMTSHKRDVAHGETNASACSPGHIANPFASDEQATRFAHLTVSLLNWQEQQSVLLHIDDRFRFRCLLS